MVRFQQPIDEVFQDMVREALDWMIEDLTDSAREPEVYPQLLPNAARFLDRSFAMQALRQLKAGNEAPEFYQPGPPHWFLLHDVLIRYCELFNSEPYGAYGLQVHEKYGLHHLNCQMLIDAFLGAHDVERGSLRNGKLQEAALVLERIKEQPAQASVIPADASKWYRRGIESYPVELKENRE